MTIGTSDADARFDRTIDHSFRDQLDCAPTSQRLGLHRHDVKLASGTRGAIERRSSSTAGHRRAVGDRPVRAAHDRPIDHDLAIHQARIGLYWQNQDPPRAGSSRAAGYVGKAIFPLFTHDFAPIAGAGEHRVAARGGPTLSAGTRER